MHESAIRGLRRRLGAMLSLRQLILWTTLFGFGWGTVTLAVRVVSGDRPEWLIWGMLALPVLAVVAILRGLRQTPSASAVRALIDRASLHGGLFMAADEQPLGDWSDRLRDSADLRVRWDARRSLALFTTASLFLAVAFLFPQRLASWQGGGLEVGEDVRQLISKIDLLKEEGILDPKRAEFLQDKLQQVRDEAKGREPAKTLEALEHVRDQLMKAAQQAAQNAAKKNEKLGLAEALAKSLNKFEGAIDPKLAKEALAELAALIQQASEETALLDQGLDPELLKDLQDLNLTPEQMKALADALKNCKGGVCDSFGKLAKARLIDAETLKKLIEAGKCKGGDCEDGEECIVGLLGQCKSGCRPGRGGITRGPGQSDITWTDGTNEDNLKFKEIVLPPGDVRKSKIVGVGKADPKAGDVSVSGGGALQRGNAGGGGANAGVLLPQHRAAVERFFQRSEKK